MKKSVLKSACLFTVLFVISHNIFAQGIFSVTIIPANPTPEDSVKAIAYVWLPSGECWLQGAGVSMTGQDVNVYAGYDAGLLTVICYSTDTVTLGRFSPGNYTCNYNMIYPYYTSAIDDIQSVSFTVSGAAGVVESGNSKPGIILLRIDRNNYEINYTLPEAIAGVTIFNPTGQILQCQKVSSGKSGSIPFNLKTGNGMIFISVTTTTGKYYTGKFILL